VEILHQNGSTTGSLILPTDKVTKAKNHLLSGQRVSSRAQLRALSRKTTQVRRDQASLLSVWSMAWYTHCRLLRKDRHTYTRFDVTTVWGRHSEGPPIANPNPNTNPIP